MLARPCSAEDRGPLHELQLPAQRSGPPRRWPIWASSSRATRAQGSCGRQNLRLNGLPYNNRHRYSDGVIS